MNPVSPPQCLTDDDRGKVFDALPLEVLMTLFVFPQLFVAGGFIRAVLAGEKVKDIDIFTTDTSIIHQAVRFYIRQCEGCGMLEVETPCTITVRRADLLPVQFVNNIAYESPEQCLEQFDFTVCQAAFWHDENGWQTLCKPEFIRDVADKRLVYTAPNRVEAPGGSLWRAFKYAMRGYTISQQELARLIERLINGLDKEPEVPITDDERDECVDRDHLVPPVDKEEQSTTTRIVRAFSMGGGYF